VAFSPKEWEDEPHLLEVLQGKRPPISKTPAGAVALIDMEKRLSDYTDESVEGAGSAVETVASKATLTLGSPTPGLVEVTGTTEVKKISAVAKGKRVTFLFKGALTVKNGENLKLGADFTATANATLTLICDGTNWYPA
jgi:hypothetical protein